MSLRTSVVWPVPDTKTAGLARAGRSLFGKDSQTFSVTASAVAGAADLRAGTTGKKTSSAQWG